MRSPEPPGSDAAGKAKRLLALSLEPTDRTFGEYELLGEIGEGATAVVHRARKDGAIVALKIMLRAHRATPAERSRFLNGAQTARLLRHENIVRVLEVGEHDGFPYVEMTLVEGRSLQEVLEEGPPADAEVLRWMLAIARAIEHAHAKGVCHRDLKPANILIDGGRNAHVVDFGLAKQLDEPATDTPHPAGTIPYMAPEQASGESVLPTFEADVYSLGMIFYRLLTGRVVDPDADPAPPRSLRPSFGRSFEDICRKCLEQDPARRYHKGAELVADLGRAVRGDRTVARPPSVWRRAGLWARRHPRAGAALAAASVLGLVAAALALVLWRGRAAEEARVLDTNAFIASAQAGAVLFQLRDYADRVERAARDPTVRALLSRGEVVATAPPELMALAAGFEYVFLETNDGTLIAQAPWVAPRILGLRFDFRDYFQGARQMAVAGVPGVYVARAYRSESRGLLEFALSAPVFASDGAQLGVVAVSFSARAAFGAVRMTGDLAGSGRITTALLGPRDNDRAAGGSAPRPPDFTFLVHPGLGKGAEHTLRAPHPSQLRGAVGPAAAPGQQFSMQDMAPLKVSDHHDPIPGFQGRWLAAFAPVGKTGFVVLVETPKEAVGRWPGLTWGLAVPAGVAVALPLVAAGAIAAGRRRTLRARR